MARLAMAAAPAQRTGALGRSVSTARPAASRSRAPGIRCRAAKITLLPGDGIGPEITDASVKVLKVLPRVFHNDSALVTEAGRFQPLRNVCIVILLLVMVL